jgi:hypothetical protein
MATIGGQVYTFADWAKRVDDNYKIASIVELLSQTNEILADMLVMEGNLPTGHKTTVRTGLPTATWRLLNSGVALSKSTTAQIVETTGNLEAENQIDVDLANLNGNTPEFRLSESKSFLEAMNQQMAQTVIYGNTATNPERFMGFAPRYNTVTIANAQTAANVIDAGGTGSTNTSIWVITWSSDTTFGIFPKGQTTGLSHTDMGKWRVLDGSGNPYWAFVDHYKWQLGMAVRDWRFAVRVCNIDVTLLSGGSAANMINLLVRAFYRLPVGPASAMPVQTSDAQGISGSMGRTAVYCNRVVRTYLDLQAMNKTNVLLQMEQWNGRPVTTFRGIPIRTVDAILNTEARVV